jgi:hypothetical protein
VKYRQRLFASLQRCRPAHTLWTQELAGAGSRRWRWLGPSRWEVGGEKAASAAVNLSSFIRYHDYRYDDELLQNAGSPV